MTTSLSANGKGREEQLTMVSASDVKALGRPSENSVAISSFARKYARLEALFGKGNVVPIGGLASNLLNSQDSRFANDRDFVAKSEIITQQNLAEWQEKAKALRFNLQISKAYAYKLRIIDMEDGGKIDLHYGMCRLGGVWKPDIVDTAHIERRVVGSEAFEYKVPDPSIFVLMKFYAWADRGQGTQHKDACDIINTVYNHFGGSIESFAEQLQGSVSQKILDDYFKHLNKKCGRRVKSTTQFAEELRYMYAEVAGYDTKKLDHVYENWFVKTLDKLKTSSDIERHLRTRVWNTVSSYYAQHADLPSLGVSRD